MPGKLLWSWTMADTRAALEKYALPKWVGNAMGTLGLVVMLYGAVRYISPIAGAWITVAASLIGVLGLFLLFNKKVPDWSSGDEHYLKLYNNGIAVNLYGCYGFYKADDIILESLAVKYILFSTEMGFGPVKGLCFRTRSPVMKVKIPLLGLLKKKRDELEEMVDALKLTNPGQ